MTQTAWAHLPNSKHIDWVLASAKAHPKKWAAAYDAACDEARKAAWDAFDAARTAACDAGRNAAFDAIAALIAYDDCAYMIESDVDEIKILAILGDQKARLLLPACIVYNETKELV